MKKHISVFMLMARSTIYKLLGLLILMAAVEGILFWLILSRGALEDGFSLELVIRQSRIIWVFGVCFLLMTLLLSLTGCEGKSRCGYTLRRLSVSERWVFVWQSVYNVLCYLLLWAVQILTVIALCRLYEAKAAPEYVSGQTVFLAFYRSGFLHSLLPFEETVFWVRNAVFAVTLGICAARFPLAQRKGKRFSEIIVLAFGVLWLFSWEIGAFGNCFFAIVFALFCAGIAICRALGAEVTYEA